MANYVKHYTASQEEDVIRESRPFRAAAAAAAAPLFIWTIMQTNNAFGYVYKKEMFASQKVISPLPVQTLRIIICMCKLGCKYV